MATVLTNLKSKDLEGSDLSLMALTLHTVMLMVLTSPSRSTDLSKLDLAGFMNTPVCEGAMFLLPKLAKQSNPNKEIKKFFFHSVKEDKNLCSVYSLSLCVEKQGKLHVQGHQSKGI